MLNNLLRRWPGHAVASTPLSCFMSLFMDTYHNHVTYPPPQKKKILILKNIYKGLNESWYGNTQVKTIWKQHETPTTQVKNHLKTHHKTPITQVMSFLKTHHETPTTQVKSFLKTQLETLKAQVKNHSKTHHGNIWNMFVLYTSTFFSEPWNPSLANESQSVSWPKNWHKNCIFKHQTCPQS